MALTACDMQRFCISLTITGLPIVAAIFNIKRQIIFYLVAGYDPSIARVHSPIDRPYSATSVQISGTCVLHGRILQPVQPSVEW